MTNPSTILEALRALREMIRDADPGVVTVDDLDFEIGEIIKTAEERTT